MTEQELIETREYLLTCDTNKLLTHCEAVYTELQNPVDKAQFESLCIERATVLRSKMQVQRLFKAIHQAEDRKQREERRQREKAERITTLKAAAELYPDDIPLELNRLGLPAKTIGNYLSIMQHDPYYSGLRYNTLAARYELHEMDSAGNPVSIKFWDDTERAKSLYHIEQEYASLLDESCHDNAFRIIKAERSFNPITSRIESLPAWDGVERCENFLTVNMKADNSDYTKAVSRMLFDSAVARAFNPGCKYDNVVVLVGEQGCGKSTLCECLALSDEYHAVISNADDKAVELLRGKWIVEIGEMFAVTSAKSQDKVKSFISARYDDYRIPYDRIPNQYQRSCIFIGDTNQEEFLSDPTGARRWYPVKLYADKAWGTTLAENKTILIELIEQCYAEAYYHFKRHESQLIIPPELWDEAERRQREVQSLPWYVPKIERYIRDEMSIGHLTNAMFLWENVLKQEPGKYDRRTATTLSAYLRNMKCLQCVRQRRFSDGTRQVAYEKIAEPD